MGAHRRETLDWLDRLIQSLEVNKRSTGDVETQAAETGLTGAAETVEKARQSIDDAIQYLCSARSIVESGSDVPALTPVYSVEMTAAEMLALILDRQSAEFANVKAAIDSLKIGRSDTVRVTVSDGQGINIRSHYWTGEGEYVEPAPHIATAILKAHGRNAIGERE